MQSMPDYSLIIPVYYNEGGLIPLMESLQAEVVARNPDRSHEFVFIDDGSGDRSFEELLVLRSRYDHVRIVKLTRNFGQLRALLAGFSVAQGRAVIVMSADGQDPPEMVNNMLNAHFNEGYEVVLCTRQGRDESSYRVITSRIFYTLIRKMVFPNMPDGGFDFALLGPRALKTFLRNLDADPFFQGGILWMGYKTKFIQYFRRQRITGKSRWTFWKKLTYLIDGVLSYSFFPIRLLSFLGLVISFLGFVWAIDIFISKLVWGNPVTGWAPIMIVALVIGGFQILMLGLIGEYLWRTLSQVRNREYFVIDAILEPSQADSDSVGVTAPPLT
jgi:dolichol-phosphate mannosyltransferase